MNYDSGAYDYDLDGPEPDNEGILFDDNEAMAPIVDFDNPEIAALPRILIKGPRRSGKTSIQVSLREPLSYDDEVHTQTHRSLFCYSISQ